MDNLTELMRIAGLITPPVRDQTQYTVLDGFLVDVSTGVVKGPHLHIEEVNYTNQPLFIYNRSVNTFWFYNVYCFFFTHIFCTTLGVEFLLFENSFNIIQ